MAAEAFWMIRTAGAAFPRVPFRDDATAIWRQGVEDAISALNASPMLLPGMVMKWAGETAPAGWLLCDGSELARRDYPPLYTAIGTRFGDGGNGSTTFRLPTQSECDTDISNPTPPQNISGGSVEPATPGGGSGTGGIGGGGGNNVTGGRPPDVRNVNEKEQ